MTRVSLFGNGIALNELQAFRILEELLAGVFKAHFNPFTGIVAKDLGSMPANQSERVCSPTCATCTVTFTACR